MKQKKLSRITNYEFWRIRSLSFFFIGMLMAIFLNPNTGWGQQSFCGKFASNQASGSDPNLIYFDRFGNSYNIVQSESQYLQNACENAGLFCLNFISEFTNSEKNVIKSVFIDLSAFIIQRNHLTPCGDQLGIKKINIDIEWTHTFDIAILAAASPYFRNFGFTSVGCQPERLINYPEIYRKLNGIDYDYFIPDGKIQINYNRRADFFTNIPELVASNLFDLYTVMLHEAMHLLAFHPVLDRDLFYFSPYDLLVNNNFDIPYISNNCESECYSSNYAPCGNSCEHHLGSNSVELFNDDVSHLKKVSNVMYPSLEKGQQKRILSLDERSILCEMGYQTNDCLNTDYGVVFDNGWYSSCTPYGNNDNGDELCCTNYFTGCGSRIEILIDDLLCFVHSNNQVSIMNARGLNMEISLSSRSIILNLNENANAFQFFTVFYTYSNSDGQCVVFSRAFSIIFDQSCECEFRPNNECENILCYNNFNGLDPTYGGANFGYPFFFENTPSCNNQTLDLVQDPNFSSNGTFIGLNVPYEAVVFKIDNAPYDFCKLELSVEAKKGSADAKVEVWGSQFAPCNINDKGINKYCGNPTTCSNGEVFEAVCLGELLVESLTQFSKSIHTIDQGNFSIPINYIFLINKSASNYGTIELDNIKVRVVNCATNADFSTIIDPCIEVLVIPTQTNNHQTHEWDFGDGTISSEQYPPVHTYANDGPYTIKHSVKDNCGNISESFKHIQIDCPEPTSSCSNQSGCISIGTDINSQILLSDLINGTNPLIQTTGGLFGMRILNGGCYSLQGKLIIDVWVTMLNTHWYCGPGASIEVRSWVFYSTGSVFQGCDQMWRGIVLPASNNGFFGNGIGLLDTRIQDAWHGVELSNASAITAKNTNFFDNYVGIYASGTTIYNDFKACTFENKGMMLPEYSGQSNWSNRAYAGMEINNMTQLNVISDPGIPNVFKNLKFGITSTGSNMIISGNKFIDSDWFQSIGIYIKDAGALTEIRNNNSFADLRTSIDLFGGQSAVIRISGNDFTNSRPYSNNDGFKAIKILNHPTSSVSINQYNYFDFVYGTGIEILGGLSYMNISKNNFTISGDDFRSITLDGIKKPSFVAENNFDLRASLRTGVITVNNCAMIEFKDNIMFDGPSVNGAIGFDISGSDKCLFRNNQVLFPGKGFQISGGQASQNNYCCNTAMNQPFQYSFTYYGANLNTSMRQNTLRRLDLDGDIGRQLNASNLWTLTGSNARLGNASAFKAQNNLFTFDPNVINSRPTSFTPPGIDLFWFLSSGTSTSCDTTPSCGLQPFFTGPLNPDLTLSGPYTPAETPPTGDSAELLNSIKDYLPLGSSTDDAELITYWNAAGLLENWVTLFGPEFWNENTDSVSIDSIVREWNIVERAKNQLFTPDIPLQADGAEAMSDILNTSAQISDLSTYELGYIPPVVYNIYEQMASATNKYHQVTTIMGGAVAANAGALLDHVATLPASKSFLTDRKKVWAVELKVISTGVSSITTAEWEEVRTIAQKCPLTTGKAVFEAQSLLKIIGEYYSSDIASDCETSKLRSIEKSTKVGQLYIHPNPGDGLFTIELPSELRIDQIMILDISGRCVKQINVENRRNLIVDLSLQSPGVYFYIANYGSQHVAQGKMIIIK